MRNQKHTNSARVAALNKLRDRANSESGFTLVELLIVILIIGILLAIALPTFLNQQDQANDNAAKQSITNVLHSAKGAYVSNSSAYPGEAALVTELGNDQPQYTVHAYDGGAAPSTGPNDLSVTRDSGTQVSICSKSESGRVYCARENQVGALMVAAYDGDSGTDLLAAINPVQVLFPESAQAAGQRTFSSCVGIDEDDTRECLADTGTAETATGTAAPGWSAKPDPASGGNEGDGPGQDGQPTASLTQVPLCVDGPGGQWCLTSLTVDSECSAFAPGVNECWFSLTGTKPVGQPVSEDKIRFDLADGADRGFIGDSSCRWPCGDGSWSDNAAVVGGTASDTTFALTSSWYCGSLFGNTSFYFRFIPSIWNGSEALVDFYNWEDEIRPHCVQ